MAGRKSDFTLPTLDDLFSTQEMRDDANQTEDYVCKALEHYASYLRKRAERDAR